MELSHVINRLQNKMRQQTDTLEQDTDLLKLIS